MTKFSSRGRRDIHIEGHDISLKFAQSSHIGNDPSPPLTGTSNKINLAFRPRIVWVIQRIAGTATNGVFILGDTRSAFMDLSAGAGITIANGVATYYSAGQLDVGILVKDAGNPALNVQAVPARTYDDFIEG